MLRVMVHSLSESPQVTHVLQVSFFSSESSIGGSSVTSAGVTGADMVRMRSPVWMRSPVQKALFKNPAAGCSGNSNCSG